MIKKGTWVEILQEVLASEDRANNIPKETKETPLKLWAKGFLKNDCNLGDVAEIETIIGRTLRGTVTEVNPKFTHDFGEFIPDILYIGPQAKSVLWGDDNE